MEARNRSQSSGGGTASTGEEDPTATADLMFLKPNNSSFAGFDELAGTHHAFDANHHSFDFNFDGGQYVNDKLIDGSSLLVNLLTNSLKQSSENNNNDDSASPSLSDPELSLMRAKAAAKNFNEAMAFSSPSTTNGSNSPISADDLADKRDVLRQIYLNEFYLKNECSVDTNMSTFACKNIKLTKSMQRKLFHLHATLTQASIYASENVQKFSELSAINFAELTDPESEELVTKVMQNLEYKKKVFRQLRSVSERVLIDALILCDQYYSQLTAASTGNAAHSTSAIQNINTKLWAEIRSRGCQFLGPQMQEDVLKIVLHALDIMTRMSRKVLIMYVVYALKKHYQKASKTNVGHVIQILYRAGCFKKLEKHEPLMELKKEFSKYPALRKQHDMELIKIAQETGIRLTPEQWSQKFYGDSDHKSDMQSIIDKLQSQQTLDKLMADFYEKLNLLSATNLADPHIITLFLKLKPDFECIANVNFEKRIVPMPAPKTQLALDPAKSAASKSDEKEATLTEKMRHANLTAAGSSDSRESFENEEDDDFFDDYEAANHDFLFDDDDDEDLESGEYDDEDCDDSTGMRARKFKNGYEAQAAINWPLVTDTMKRLVKILNSYLEYSTKLSSIILANNQMANAAILNSFAPPGIRPQSKNGPPQPYHQQQSRVINSANKQQPLSPNLHKSYGGYKPNGPMSNNISPVVPINLISMGPSVIQRTPVNNINKMPPGQAQAIAQMNYIMSLQQQQQQQQQQQMPFGYAVNNLFNYNNKFVYLEKPDLNQNNLVYGHNINEQFKFQQPKSGYGSGPTTPNGYGGGLSKTDSGNNMPATHFSNSSAFNTNNKKF